MIDYICGDMLDVLENQKLFDVVLTSPPYNINKKYNVYKDNKSDTEYINWMGDIFETLYRHLSDDGAIYFNINSNLKNRILPFKIACKAGEYFQLQNTIIWVKSIAIPNSESNDKTGFIGGHYSPTQSNHYHHSGFEYLLHLTKYGDVEIDKKATGIPHKYQSNTKRFGQDTRHRGDVWYVPYNTKNAHGTHPAAFPARLVEMCLADFGRIPNCVLDPFCGVGTVGNVCKKLNYNFLGIDVDNEYINDAKKVFEK